MRNIMGKRKKQPSGIWVLTAIHLLVAVCLLFASLGAIALGTILGAWNIPSTMITAFGGIMLLVAVAYFVLAYAIWNGKAIAWYVVLILNGLGFVFALLSKAWISVIIALFILVLLFEKKVAKWFGFKVGKRDRDIPTWEI